MKKSHDLPPASWRARKPSAVIRSESEGLGTRGLLAKVPESKGLRTRSSNIQEQEKMHLQLKKKKKKREREFTLLSPFCSIWIPNGLDDSPTLVRADLFTQSLHSNVNLFQKHAQRHT